MFKVKFKSFKLFNLKNINSMYFDIKGVFSNFHEGGFSNFPNIFK